MNRTLLAIAVGAILTAACSGSGDDDATPLDDPGNASAEIPMTPAEGSNPPAPLDPDGASVDVTPEPPGPGASDPDPASGVDRDAEGSSPAGTNGIDTDGVPLLPLDTQSTMASPETGEPSVPIGSVGESEPTEPFLPVAARLPSLLPGRTSLFGESIDGFPDPSVAGDSGHLVWIYRVADGELVADETVGETFEPALSHRRLWQRLSEVIPADLGAPIRAVNFNYAPPDQPAYSLASATSVGFTETPGDRTAVIGFSEPFVTETLAGIDAGHGSEAFDRVAVHEYAHVLQHADTVEIRSPDPARYLYRFGLSHPRTSPYGRYLERFWEGETSPAWTESGISFEAASLLYQSSPESFVTPYAASNPEEDFAETFELFVRLDDGFPVEGLPGAEKLRWMQEWDEGVAIRERLRAANPR